MRPSRTKTPLVLALLGAGCVMALVWIVLDERRGPIEWKLLAGAAALLVAVCAVLWPLAHRLRSGGSDRSFERPSELSTLAFPPSSFRQ